MRDILGALVSLGEAVKVGEIVGLNVGGQCVAVNVLNARQFKSKSNVPFSVALENIEVGTVAATPIVK